MKEIIQEVDINLDDNLHLEIAIDVDGETVYEERGHSFTANFLSLLYSLMSGEEYPVMSGWGTTNDSNDWQADNQEVPVSFDRWENPPASGTYYTRMGGDDPRWSDGQNIIIGGIDPAAAGGGICGGVYSIQEVPSGGSGYWILYDIANSAYVDIVDIASIDYATYEPFAQAFQLKATGSNRAEADTFQAPEILIGYSTAANVINQSFLNAAIPIYAGGTTDGSVTKGTATVSTPTVGSGQSIIEIEQSFTNVGTTVAMTIGEVGLVTKVKGADNNNRDFCLIARDVLSPTVNLPAGSVIAVKYRIIVQVDTVTNDGGILAGFNELLYRHIADTTREVKDIFNANQTDGASGGSFMVAGCGGENQWSPEYGSLNNQYLGPQIGHSTKVVANTDFRLQYAGGDTVYDGSSAIEGQDSRYPHGSGSYQALCFGPLVHGWKLNTASGYAQFQIDNIFHNVGDQDLVVNEIGCYVGRRTSTVSIGYGVAICRNRLTTPFTLTKGAGPGYPDQSGEMCRVTYIFRVNV